MRKIISILKKKKFIPLDEFINIALYHSKSGYYNKNYPFGKKGDFITFEPGSAHSSYTKNGCLILVFLRGKNKPIKN